MQDVSRPRAVCTTLTVVLATVFSHQVHAITFTSLGNYNSTIGPHSIITFQGLSSGEILANQFAGLGASFTDGDDTVELNGAFVTDGIGMLDHGSTTITFSSPMNHFGVEFPGAVTIDLYNGATLLSSDAFGGSGYGFFGGVLDVGQTFDKVVLFDHHTIPGYYDNLHFGLAIPEPTTLSLATLALIPLVTRRR